MTPERWQQVEKLYQAALEREPSQRAAFLQEACAGDEVIRQEVESLLAYEPQTEGFIQAPALQEAAQGLSADQARSLVGRQLGAFKVLSLIGAGGMGEVYRATDIRLGREVAIKVLPAEVSSDRDRLRRFLREARSASTLNHPNVATIHEIGEADGVHFIAMEYVEGQSLAAKIGGRPLDPAEIVDIAVQVADVLEEAHNKGITHRDIKPANIMLKPRGQVKVLDFGLAKVIGPGGRDVASELSTAAKTETGVVLGTVEYMSPEQVLGRELDHRSDIFSLGSVLYEMATGRRPFSGPTVSETRDRILHGQPEAMARFNYSVPAELDRIVRKCLEKDRERRYQTMRDLAIDLENLSDQFGAARVSVPRGESATDVGLERRSIFTSRRTLALSGVAILLVAAALLYALMFRGASATRQPEIRSLAVLPLVNLSGDPEQDYFADGITETLIAGLARVGALRVISRTSVMQYKGSHKSLPEIARELNVDAAVEGSVQRFGERVKVTAQLIHAPVERHLWGETYERDLRDVMALQNEIARAITQEIHIKLTAQEQMRLASARPVSAEAYDYYLRGRFHANRQNKADNETAIQMCDRAVALDPNFAAAYAELAQACVWRFFLFTPDQKQWEERAFVAVEKALSLDPDLAVAYLARGRLLWTPSHHYPHERAIQEYRRALALNPNLDEVQNQLALVYNHVGAFDRALQELEKAVATNPSNTLAQFRIGETLLFQGKYERALAALGNIPKEANPSMVGYQAPTALLHLGRTQEAAALLGEFLREYPEDHGGLFTSVQALIAALAGEENKAEDKIRRAVDKGKGFGHFHHAAYNIACAYALMNKREQAIKWLQAAADDGFPCYPLFEREPYLDLLRQDSRFVSLMKRLKEQWDHYKATL
jgi:TolB-like protein/predicted Ser/Thr protein kinase